MMAEWLPLCQRRSPRTRSTNTFVERFIQTLQQKCLDHFVVFGEKHMNCLVSEFVAHYHEERPHQSKENGILLRDAKRRKPTPDPLRLSQVKYRQRLGGLLKHYSRKAA